MSSRLEPRRLLVPAVAIGLAAVLVAIAAGTPGAVSPAPLPTGPTRVAIHVSTPPDISPRVADVALGAVSSALRSDPAVSRVVPSSSSNRTRVSVILRTGDAHEAADEINRLKAKIDPGPLKLSYGGAALDLESAGSSLRGDLGRLELLITPLVLLALLGLAGARGTALVAMSGTIAVSTSLIAIRVSNGYLFAAAPAAAIGIAQAVELSALFVGTIRDEVSVAPPGAPARALLAWIRPAAAVTAVRALLPLALLATGFGGAGSVAFAAAVAAVSAFLGVAVLGGVTLAGTSPRAEEIVGPVTRFVRAFPRWVARDRLRLLVALALPLCVTAILALPARHAILDALTGEPGSGITHDLGVAALLAALGLGAALAAGRGDLSRLRMAAASPHVLLPAAAAVGLLVWAGQEGHLSGLVTGRGAVYGGAVMVTAVSVVTIAAGRAAMAATVTLHEARRAGPVEAAQLAVRMTLPAALASSLVVGAAFATLAGADLDLAAEAGLAVAAGTLLDLVLWRLPFVAFLARWGEG